MDYLITQMTDNPLVAPFAVLALFIIGAAVFMIFLNFILNPFSSGPCRCGMAQPNHLDDKCAICRCYLDDVAEKEYYDYQRSMKKASS